jgi:hypothetical protein
MNHRSAKFHIIMWLLFSLFTVILLYPCVPFFLIGGKIQPGDASYFAWSVAWIQKSILHHPRQLFDANILYPLPHSLVYTAAVYTPAFLSLPIRILTDNPVLIYNIMIYLSFVIAGTGAFYFIRKISGSTYGAILGGFIFAFCVQRLWRANGHLNVLQSCWIPYFFLALLHYYQAPKWKRGLLVGLSFLALLLGCLYNTVIALAGAAILTLYWWKTKEFRITTRMLAGLLIVFVCVIAIFYPFAKPYTELKEVRFNILDDLIPHSASLSGYFIPPHQPGVCMTLMGTVLYKPGAKLPRGEDVEFLGYFVFSLTLIEVLLSIFHREAPRKSSLFYAGFGLFFLIISLGPCLKITEHPLPVPLPYLFIYTFVRPLNFMRAVNRYSILVFLALGVLVGNLWSREFVTKLSKCKGFLFFLAALLIIGLEYFSISYTAPRPFQASPLYSYVKSLPDDPVILDLSTSLDQAILNSTLHWKKMIGGAYMPDGYVQDLQSMCNPGALTWLLFNKYGVNYVLCGDPGTYDRFSNLPYLQWVVPEMVGVLKFVSPNPAGTVESFFAQRIAREGRKLPRLVLDKQFYKKCWKDNSIVASKQKPYVYRTTGRVNSSILAIPPFSPAAFSRFSVTMRAKSFTDRLTKSSLYWSTPEAPQMNEENTISWVVTLDNKFHTYSVDLSASWQWVISTQITKLRFDPVVGRNVEFEIAEIRLHH